MSQNLFMTSSIGWFPGAADDVLATIARASQVGDQTLRNAFRTSPVDAAETRTRVAPAVERLSRWDLLPPFVIFNSGFPSRRTPQPNDFTADQYNIRTYVASNTASVFVGTTRYYRNPEGALRIWQRRLTTATNHRFLYEIFAFGGIDVNSLLGAHNYTNQHEVAFPGGIGRQFIRSAREYVGNSIVAVWDNPNFDVGANQQYAPSLEELPHPIRGRPFPVYLFPYEDGNATPPPVNRHEELRKKREAGGDELELMLHEPGDSLADTYLGQAPIPRVARACVLDETDPNKAYFFAGNMYLLSTVEGGTTEGALLKGPNTIGTVWQALRNARFGAINAILRHPTRKNEAYIFSFNRYAIISFTSDANSSLITGPRLITDDWPSLKQASFDSIDAALPNPKNKEEAYFFSGDKYVLVKLRTGDNTIVVGPHTIISQWPSLKKANFPTIDAVLPNPKNPTVSAYFFSGPKYALIEVKPGTNDDSIINGPVPVRDNWPGLKKGLFY